MWLAPPRISTAGSRRIQRNWDSRENWAALSRQASTFTGARIFATGQYIHGGEDIAINTILIHLMVKGMMTYSGGAACGKPVIHLGPVAISPDKEGFRELFRIYGKRFAEQAAKIRV